MGYFDIGTYYKINFNLMQHYNYNLYDINELYPFERDIYVKMLSDYIDEVNENNKKNNAS